jgi:hypothetical protein
MTIHKKRHQAQGMVSLADASLGPKSHPYFNVRIKWQYSLSVHLRPFPSILLALHRSVQQDSLLYHLAVHLSIKFRHHSGACQSHILIGGVEHPLMRIYHDRLSLPGKPYVVRQSALGSAASSDFDRALATIEGLVKVIWGHCESPNNATASFLMTETGMMSC